MNAQHQSYPITPCELSHNPVTTRVALIEKCDSDLPGQLAYQLDPELFEVTDVSNGSDDLLKRVHNQPVDVLILSVDILDPQLLEQLIKINHEAPLPIVVFAKRHVLNAVKIVLDAGVNAYVVDDMQAQRVPLIIDVAIARFAQINSLSSELQLTQNKLSERKLIERAKGILMQQKRLTEKQAYAQLRKSAMDQGRSMASLSKRIISVFEMLG